MGSEVRLPAEWEAQSGVQLTWPHPQTDWAPCLKEAVDCFVRIAREIAAREQLLVVTPDVATTKKALKGVDMARVAIVPCDTNDTWSRDHGGITVLRGDEPVVLDYQFNGWGLKFPAGLDNRITGTLFDRSVFADAVAYGNRLSFALEGGAIESDGRGTILTTSECLLSVNRNGGLSKEDIEGRLRADLGASRLLWLDHGGLEGDDTDSHIDTLARFCSADTIAYVHCDDEGDGHFEPLRRMREQLRTFTTATGSHYRLLPLPMAEPIFFEGARLPATYANFLIINGAVLVPFYETKKDAQAAEILSAAFPERDIVGIDCRVLIRQHGSLHCVTMQYPSGVLRKEAR